jgi:hypothetical protein
MQVGEATRCGRSARGACSVAFLTNRRATHRSSNLGSRTTAGHLAQRRRPFLTSTIFVFFSWRIDCFCDSVQLLRLRVVLVDCCQNWVQIRDRAGSPRVERVFKDIHLSRLPRGDLDVYRHVSDEFISFLTRPELPTRYSTSHHGQYRR